MKDSRIDVAADVMSVLDSWSRALWDKDLEALRSCYADDVMRVFDLGAQFTGYDQMSALWKHAPLILQIQ